jgi:hypothetical protein
VNLPIRQNEMLLFLPKSLVLKTPDTETKTNKLQKKEAIFEK